jgi:hypothetical protein
VTVFLALLAVLIPASLTLAGQQWTKQADKRATRERQDSAARLAQHHDDEQARLKLDAAMHAAKLFSSADGRSPEPAASAAGLLALTELGQADLAVALLVDLWDAQPPEHDVATSSNRLSTESAILVINRALGSLDNPNAQLIAAELLCRNARRLDPCQSLHWPAAIDGRWIPSLRPRAKLLIIDALVEMTHSSDATENALRVVAMRLYGAWRGDAENERVRGCVGQLIAAVLPALQELGYDDFMSASEVVTLHELEEAAATATANPDGYLERFIKDRSERLQVWSAKCDTPDLRPGRLALAS